MSENKKSILLLDVDGVIFNSNILKEDNIYKAASQFTDEQRAKSFVAYFTSLNGVPREEKINHFFNEDKELANNILETYNHLNNNSLYTVQFTKNALEVLKTLSNYYQLIALSGGKEEEVKKLFHQKDIIDLFEKVLGGPKKKNEHLKDIDCSKIKYFVGDSKVDFEASLEGKIPFVFMKDYTQYQDWQKFFNDKPDVKVINNLEELTGILT